MGGQLSRNLLPRHDGEGRGRHVPGSHLVIWEVVPSLLICRPANIESLT